LKPLKHNGLCFLYIFLSCESYLIAWRKLSFGLANTALSHREKAVMAAGSGFFRAKMANRTPRDEKCGAKRRDRRSGTRCEQGRENSDFILQYRAFGGLAGEMVRRLRQAVATVGRDASGVRAGVCPRREERPVTGGRREAGASKTRQ